MRFLFGAFLLLAICYPIGVQSQLFFPEEVVSLLSFVYSILPPFKLGKDSRFGAGFRVGNNADFQVLIELGPQSETQPIGPDSGSKREARANANGGREYVNGNRRKSLKRMKTKTPQSTSTTVAPKEGAENITRTASKESLNSNEQESS